jgi:hypothetical protein
MKTMNIFGTEQVVYEESDREMLAQLKTICEYDWHNNWVKSGAKDEGSCCLGKGIRVYFLPKRKRTPRSVFLARCDFVQGNVSAYRSVQPVLERLKNEGIACWYDDGNMD